MSRRLEGRCALVTGASRGFGLAVAGVLAAAGCRLHLAARREAGLAAAKASLVATGTVIDLHPADLSEPVNASVLALECDDADILVNAAGCIRPASADHFPIREWRETWALKVLGTEALSREMAQIMARRGGGGILTLLAPAPAEPDPGYIHAAMANAALRALSEALAIRHSRLHLDVLSPHPAQPVEAVAVAVEERLAAWFSEGSLA